MRMTYLLCAISISLALLGGASDILESTTAIEIVTEVPELTEQLLIQAERAIEEAGENAGIVPGRPAEPGPPPQAQPNRPPQGPPAVAPQPAPPPQIPAPQPAPQPAPPAAIPTVEPTEEKTEEPLDPAIQAILEEKQEEQQRELEIEERRGVEIWVLIGLIVTVLSVIVVSERIGRYRERRRVRRIVDELLGF